MPLWDSIPGSGKVEIISDHLGFAYFHIAIFFYYLLHASFLQLQNSSTQGFS